MPPINRARLRDRRDELDLRNRVLADRLEISESYLNNIICGVNEPSQRLIYRMERVLALAVGELTPDELPADAKPRRRPRETKTPPDRAAEEAA
jgi:transcriptional regulator with XRE-family HTH domain